MRRLKTLRRPPIYPKTPGHLPCSPLTHPLPLPSRRPSVSFGGFGLSQKHNFEGEIALIKSNSRITDLESYSVRCCLVIGTIPDDEERKKSFELFRGNSKNVEIVTFDELLEKLKRLRDLLKSPNPELGRVPQSMEDLPF